MKRLSLKARFLLIFALCIFSIQTFNYIQFQKSLNTQKEHIVDNFNLHSEALASSIAAQFYERYGDVQAFAKNEILMSTEKPRIIEALNSYVALYGIYDLILFVAPDGKLIAVNNQDPKGKNIDTQELYGLDYSSQEWFQKVIAGQTTDDSSKGFTGTYVEQPQNDFYIHQVYKEDRKANSFSAIVKDSHGKVIGVLSNRANFKWVEDELNSAFHNHQSKGLSSVLLTLVGPDGNILASRSDKDSVNFNTSLQAFTPVEQIRKKGSGVFQGMDPRREGVEQVIGYSFLEHHKFISNLNWGVMVQANAKDLFAGLISANTYFLVGLFAFTTVALVLCWIVISSLAKHIQSITVRIAENTIDVATSSEQVSFASQTISKGAVESAASIETSVACMEEISSVTKKNNDSAENAALLSQDCQQKAKVSSDVLGDLRVSIQQIHASSKEITEITSVIEDIAFQTNLLALNAAVEAARAGEQGKGFAVVADAVRTLALRSSEAAKNISQLITKSADIVSIGTKKAEETESAIKSMIQLIEKIAYLNQEISQASREQTIGIQQFGKTMNEIDSASQSNASVAEELSATAEVMMRKSQTLKTVTQELESVVNGDKAHDPLPMGKEPQGTLLLAK
ncbi:methyl-accepting chemotaxis protein [Bdellovibrio sp. HCB-162]|uniref:methyl-accepting chemotaxis protein n=1 Tax=Bdellovibrio sp. HCB-162 TaxID=3394234 RepID=UPI0039BC95CF